MESNLNYLRQRDNSSRTLDNYLKQVSGDQKKRVLSYTLREPKRIGCKSGRIKLDNGHYILFFLVKGERKVQYSFDVDKKTIYHRPLPYNKDLTKCIGLIDIENTKKYRLLVKMLSVDNGDIHERNEKYIKSLDLKNVKKVNFSFIEDIPTESIRCLHEKIDPIYEKLITSDDGECGCMNKTLGVTNIKFSLTYSDIDIIPYDTNSPRPSSDRKVVDLKDIVSFSDNDLYKAFMHTIKYKDQKLTIIVNKNVIGIYYIYLEYMNIALLHINIVPDIAINIIETQLSLYRPFIQSPCNLSGFIEKMKHKTIPISKLLEIKTSKSNIYTYPVVDQNNGFFSIINKYLFDESGKITEAMEKVLTYYKLEELETNEETYIFKSKDAPIVAPIESSEKKTSKRTPKKKTKKTLAELKDDPTVKKILKIREKYDDVEKEKEKFKELSFSSSQLEDYFEYLSMVYKDFPFKPRGAMSSKIDKLMIYKYPDYVITNEMLEHCERDFSLNGLKYIYKRLTGDDLEGRTKGPLCEKVTLKL
jgi:hypothetical protein